MPVDNATLRFIAATDGRGEGLAGIDLAVADRDAIVDAARNRGCVVDGNRVMIGGVQFNLQSTAGGRE